MFMQALTVSVLVLVAVYVSSRLVLRVPGEKKALGIFSAVAAFLVFQYLMANPIILMDYYSELALVFLALLLGFIGLIRLR